MVAAIRIQDLNFRYPRQVEPALRDVSLQIESGECVLLLGPTGCGKSTLALCLNGLIPHLISGEMQGHVYIQGVDTQQSTVGELAREVGLVFQDPEAQFCMLMVEDEIAFGLENLGVPRQQMDPRIEAALALVGLPAERHTRLDRLSGGMKQRLALAAVLAMGPRILVLDEPTSNLDPQATAEFFAHLTTLKTRGYTILLIEHKLDDLMQLVDRVVVMGPQGNILSSGKPRAIFQAEAAHLLQHGIWLPQVTELAFHLAQEGMPLKPFPLNVAEAAQLLARHTYPQARLVPSNGPYRPAQTRDEPPTRTQANASSASRTTEARLEERRGSPGVVTTNLSGPGERIVLKAVSLEYTYPRGPQALRGIDLEVKEGEFLALVGANGSGKTTLALHLCGVLIPSKGQVFLDGHNVAALPREKVAAQIGYVFQNPEHQFVAGTVLDELAYGLRQRHMAEADLQPKVTSMLREFALADYAEVNPFKLSQGQKRRLSVATMLILGQKVLILDEPTFGQDRSNTYRLMDELRALQRTGHTILFATHDMRLVAEYATRVVVLDEGHVLFDGKPQHLFAQPHILSRAQLRVPTLYALSQAIASSQPPPLRFGDASQPAWPPLATIAEYCSYLKAGCA